MVGKKIIFIILSFLLIVNITYAIQSVGEPSSRNPLLSWLSTLFRNTPFAVVTGDVFPNSLITLPVNGVDKFFATCPSTFNSGSINYQVDKCYVYVYETSTLTGVCEATPGGSIQCNISCPSGCGYEFRVKYWKWIEGDGICDTQYGEPSTSKDCTVQACTPSWVGPYAVEFDGKKISGCYKTSSCTIDCQQTYDYCIYGVSGVSAGTTGLTSPPSCKTQTVNNCDVLTCAYGCDRVAQKCLQPSSTTTLPSSGGFCIFSQEFNAYYSCGVNGACSTCYPISSKCGNCISQQPTNFCDTSFGKACTTGCDRVKQTCPSSSTTTLPSSGGGGGNNLDINPIYVLIIGGLVIAIGIVLIR